MRHWIRKIAAFLLHAIACVIILAAIFGVALTALTPVINHHKADVEHYVSSLIHADVQIENIQANWARFGPEIHFKGITLSEHDKVLVKADDLTMHIGIFRTAWRRSIYFRSLSLSGSGVVIHETAPHQYLINDAFSVDLSDNTRSQLPEIFSWFVTQNHIHLSHVHVGLQQLNKNAVTIQLDQANIYQADKRGSQKGLSVFVEGHVSAETVEGVHVPKVFKSDVILSAWMTLVQQRITFAELELLVRNLVLQEEKKTRLYPSFEGVFVWQPVGDNWLLQGKEVTLTKTSHESGDYSFELWRFPHYYAAHVNAVDLSDVAFVSDFFNVIPAGLDLEQAHVRGSIEDIDAMIPQDFSQVDQYRFSAAVRDFSSDVYQALPEIHHLSGAFSGSVSQGSFMLLDKDDTVYFPLYFNQAIPVTRVTANGQWNVASDRLSLSLNSMHVISPEVEAQGAMKLEVPLTLSDDSVMLSLLGQYHLKHSQAAVKFLPMKEFDPDFAKWLTTAVGNGVGSDGKVLIRGSIDCFPYSKQEGVFIVDGSVRPLDVSFSPEWPAVNNISGSLLLHNQMFGMNMTASVDGLAITQASVTVPDYKADDAILNVDVQAAGEAADYVRYIHQTPLKTTLGEWLSPFDLTGPGMLSLHLALPIAHMDNDHIQVNGEWLAQGAGFSWKALKNAGVKNIKGAIHFTQDSISADQLHATLGNQPLQLSINTEKEKGVMTAIGVDAQGVFSVPELKTLSQVDGWSLYLSGRSPFHAHLRVPMMKSDYLMSFDTDLRGMKVMLPEDLGKEAKTAVPFSVNVSLNPVLDVAQCVMNYTKNISATIIVQHYSQEKARTLQVDAHAVAFSWPLAISMPMPKTTDSTSPSLWQSLTALTVHVSHLSLYKHDLSSVLLSGVRNPNDFSWKIQANEARGSVVMPFDSKQAINANFNYVTLSTTKKITPTPVDAATPDVSAKIAATWPPFYIEIEQFKMGKQDWGKTIVQTTPIVNGVNIDKIYLQNSYHDISAHGRWVNNGAEDITNIDGEFTTTNLGKFLSVNDITQNFQAKGGVIKYSLHWLGSPMKFQLKTLEGDASVNVKDGVIPLSGDSAKNGLGKVLTLFSAQSIQRRLQLNFSDLGDNGYSFNSLISTLHFHGGTANVEKGVFDGPEAKIGFTGRVGLVKQDYDLYLVVTPYVTSSLPLIATLAGGPIAGVATYAFDKIAAGSIAKFTSYKYLLRGPWTQPQLISLDLEAEKKPEEKNIAPVEEAS